MKAVVDTGSVFASKAAGFRFDNSCDSIWYLATGYDYGLIFDYLAPVFFRHNTYAVLAAELDSSSTIAKKLGLHKRAFGKLGLAAANKRRHLELNIDIEGKHNFCDLSILSSSEEIKTLLTAIYKGWNALIFLSEKELNETDKKEILSVISEMYRASGTDFSQASSLKLFHKIAAILFSKKCIVVMLGEDLSDTRAILISGHPEQIIEFSELANTLIQTDSDPTPTPLTRNFTIKTPFARRRMFEV
ncbi:hypothetical protein [Pseudomonas sp. H1h]|uniref:hypothetical protein n=1 Tax=Pseudomonas sp. H1h TaxID=1397280 RepID=UPI0004699180|nr:hypothetical protein [Pseudomonas sp. H1h]